MSLTLAEARTRAARLSDISYDVALDLTSPDSGIFDTTRAPVVEEERSPVASRWLRKDEILSRNHAHPGG